MVTRSGIMVGENTGIMVVRSDIQSLEAFFRCFQKLHAKTFLGCS